MEVLDKQRDSEHFNWLVKVFCDVAGCSLEEARKLALITIEYEKPNRGKFNREVI